MGRAEFKKDTKRAALKRSGNQCEALGKMYGLLPRQRCGVSLARGVEFDHIILDANSHDNSLANCAAVCIRCHRWKTSHVDTLTAAKTLRQQDKHNGITKPKFKWASRGFGRAHDNTKRLEEL